MKINFQASLRTMDRGNVKLFLKIVFALIHSDSLFLYFKRVREKIKKDF
ncbi:hypothetical protein HMPREF0497_0644 [Lentilactobacillus buchneri ATCC 11577]|nr:hypothetical protein HMPREF0497_0644 [Lentilactobacillus buchneri ATCC 11577]